MRNYEALNTAALRHLYTDRPSLLRDDVFTLCEALDDARQEIAYAQTAARLAADTIDAANAEIARLTVMTDEMRRGLESHREWAQLAAARYRQNYKDLSSKSESAYRAVTAERALDAANVKLTALLNMVPRYAYIDEDDRLVVKHDDMCEILNRDVS